MAAWRNVQRLLGAAGRAAPRVAATVEPSAGSRFAAAQALRPSRVPDVPAGRGRRLHRFLFLDSPCHECRPDVSPGQSAAAELQARADCVPRTLLIADREWYAGAPAKRPARRRQVWPDARAGL